MRLGFLREDNVMISRRTFLASSLMAIGALAMPKSALGGTLVAPDVENKISSLASTLSEIEAYKFSVGLDDVDFSSLSICQPISFYEAVNGTIQEIEPRYPILDQHSDIRMLAYDIGAESMIVTTALAEQINDAVNDGNQIAVVYDSNGCYLLQSSGDLIKVGESSYTVSTRDSLKDSSRIDASDAAFSELDEIGSIDALASSLSRSTRSIIQVGYVTQNPPSNICWAACVASIANYRNGGSKTAKSVAQAYYGSSYNLPLQNIMIPAVLAANGVNGYTYYTSWPSDSTINSNLDSGYPLVGILSVNGNTQSTHAVVVHGCTTSISIFVMDPEFGFTTASKLGSSYIYSSGYSGASLRTIEVVRRK